MCPAIIQQGKQDMHVTYISCVGIQNAILELAKPADDAAIIRSLVSPYGSFSSSASSPNIPMPPAWESKATDWHETVSSETKQQVLRYSTTNDEIPTPKLPSVKSKQPVTN